MADPEGETVIYIALALAVLYVIGWAVAFGELTSEAWLHSRLEVMVRETLLRDWPWIIAMMLTLALMAMAWPWLLWRRLK